MSVVLRDFGIERQNCFLFNSHAKLYCSNFAVRNSLKQVRQTNDLSSSSWESSGNFSYSTYAAKSDSIADPNRLDQMATKLARLFFLLLRSYFVRLSYGY